MSITVGIAGITDSRFVPERLQAPQQFRESPRVNIVQGESSDLETLRSFVGGCDVVICCYLGDNNLMIEGQKLLVDACELENVGRYVASDYCLDFTKLELGQHPAKDPMKHMKAYLDGKKNVQGVHVLIGAFMETFWSGYFGIFDPKEIKFSFCGDGDEIWESTTYETAAEYVAAVALDQNAVGLQHFLGDRKSIKEIAKEFSQVYGLEPKLESLGSKQNLFNTMQAVFNKDPSNIFAYLAMFYQYYCINGQTYLKRDLDNKKYPQVTPVTFKGFLESHKLEDLAHSYQNAGTQV